MHSKLYQKSLSQDPKVTWMKHVSKTIQDQFRAHPNMVLILAQRFPVPLGHSIDESGIYYL